MLPENRTPQGEKNVFTPQSTCTPKEFAICCTVAFKECTSKFAA